MRYVKTEDITRYMNDISKIDTLSREDEIRLSEEMRNEDQSVSLAARDRLICSNLRLVVKIAHEFKGKGVGFADLVEEGNIGLMTATYKYDPEKGVKFSCYASWWIKEAMHRAIQRQSRLIRMPGGSVQRMMKIVKARRRYMQETGEEPSTEEISSMTGMSVESVDALIQNDISTVSMDENISDMSDTTFESVIADKVDESESKNKIREAVASAVATLNDLDRLIVENLFGLVEQPVDEKSMAQETGMPVETLKKRLAGILASLQPMLADCLA